MSPFIASGRVLVNSVSICGLLSLPVTFILQYSVSIYICISLPIICISSPSSLSFLSDISYFVLEVLPRPYLFHKGVSRAITFRRACTRLNCSRDLGFILPRSAVLTILTARFIPHFNEFVFWTLPIGKTTLRFGNMDCHMTIDIRTLLSTGSVSNSFRSFLVTNDKCRARNVCSKSGLRFTNAWRSQLRSTATT